MTTFQTAIKQLFEKLVPWITNPSNYWKIFILLILIVSDIIGWFSFLSYKSAMKTSEQTYLSFRNDYETQIDQLKTENKNLSSAISDEKELTRQQKDEISKLEAKLSDIQRDYQKAQSDANAVNEKNESLEKLFCDYENIPEFNYTGNSEISKKLQEFEKIAQRGKPGEAAWEQIWNNSDTTIHHINAIEESGHVHGEHYVVFFSEDNHFPGIFWMNKQCWLDFQREENSDE